jgi:hypothetical protein
VDLPHLAPPPTRSTGRSPAARVAPGARERLPRPTLLAALVQAAVLAALPDGGQGVARRNAWAGMSADAARARARREADAALAQAQVRADVRDRREPVPSGRRVAAHG